MLADSRGRPHNNRVAIPGKAKRGEKQRLQQADVAGRQFVFREKENREIAQLNRVASQIGMAAQAEQQAANAQLGAITGAIGGIASMAGSYMGAKSD